MDSSTGRISGEMEERLIVWTGWDTTVDCVLVGRVSASLELKSSCENVTGVGACRNCSERAGDDAPDEPRKTVMPPVNCSNSRWSIAFLASESARRNSRSCARLSMARFSASNASTSCRLRSLDDWAARRLRRTRSTRRCSFSSSVFARFLCNGLAD